MADMPEHDIPDQQTVPENAGIARRSGDDRPISSLDEGASVPDEGEGKHLLASEQCMRLDKEWQEIQTAFVDSPRASVEKADALVTKAMDALAASFSEMRNSLDKEWEDGDSTEGMRRTLQNYRSIFRRLLAI